MTDVSKMIEPKSDQLNYDDLLGGALSGTVTRVDVKNTKDQPISVHLDSFNRPWKPCKSMARILAAVWGRDSSGWVGHSVTIYGDSSVKWAGVEVGGIRLSHISGIDRSAQFSTTLAKGKRKTVTISPMASPATQQPQPKQAQQEQQNQPQAQPQAASEEEIAHHVKLIICSQSAQDLIAAWGRIPNHIKPRLEEAKNHRKAELQNPAPEPTAQAPTIENF